MTLKKPLSLMLPLLIAFTILMGACSDNGSGGVTSTQALPPAGGSVTLTGTVSGTVIKVLRADSGAVIAQTDTASLPGSSPFLFSLSGIPTGVPIKGFFFSAGQTFPFYGGIPPTNVFKMQTAGTIALGSVTMSGGRATASNPVTNVTFEPEDVSPPPSGVTPPAARLTVTPPGSASGSVVVSFSVENFTIGGQGQQHLHIKVDTNPSRHFFNGLSDRVVDGSQNRTTDVEWQSASSFRLNGLSDGLHQVTVKLATAADEEFVNPEATSAVPVTITSPPAPLATLTLGSPSSGASLPSGPVNVSFTVNNFTIGSLGSPHLHIYLDGGAAAHFYNGTTNQVLDGNGQSVANISRQSNTSFQVAGLSSGAHTIRLVLADVTDQDLQNAEANPPTLNITIQAPSGTSTVTVTSGTSFPSSPVTITFSVGNFIIGLPGTPHLRFSIDGGPVNDFYNGADIDSDNGVLLNGLHTHFVHWASATSFNLFGLTAGAHQVRLALVDQNNQEFANVGASTTHNFDVQQPQTGGLQLQPVLSNLNYPSGLSLAPDGRIFYNELYTGKIRTISSSWQLDPTPFCEVSIGPISGEQGLLGLTLDPNFTTSNSLYVYYTVSGATMNRVSRLTRFGGVCTETIVLDNLPVSATHNGGIIKFGPDGRLYVVIGDTTAQDNAQVLTSLSGKILRINSDGSAPSDNPFSQDPNPNAQKVFSYGHRNSYGITFHPQTNDLWESENGQNDNDEINHIVSGGNYGWPNAAGIVIGSPYRNPIHAFNPVIAPTGVIVIPGDSLIYPSGYHNNLLVAAYNDGTIRHVVLGGADLDQFGGASVAYTGGQGGLFSMMLGVDGYVYTSNSNSIFRVVPH